VDIIVLNKEPDNIDYTKFRIKSENQL